MNAGLQYRLVRKGGREAVEAFRRRWEMDHLHVKVGLPDDVMETDADGKETNVSLATIGRAHEFGTIAIGGHIPERSWLRGGLKNCIEGLKRINKINLRLIGDGKQTPMRALEQLGSFAVGEVKKYIRSKPFTPLADSTLAAREHSLGREVGSLNADNTTPLVDEGNMIQAITYEVVERGE
jgi:hypothetical protein